MCARNAPNNSAQRPGRRGSRPARGRDLTAGLATSGIATVDERADDLVLPTGLCMAEEVERLAHPHNDAPQARNAGASHGSHRCAARTRPPQATVLALTAWLLGSRLGRVGGADA